MQRCRICTVDGVTTERWRRVGRVRRRGRGLKGGGHRGFWRGFRRPGRASVLMVIIMLLPSEKVLLGPEIQGYRELPMGIEGI